MPQGDNGSCFVIAPIGEPNSEIRKRSDQVFKHILQPASKECGFEAIRADQIEEPGIITDQVIHHIIEDPVIIADLTGRNPNVFYELAIRHVLRKPYVQVIQAGEEKPFDVAGIRTIEVNHRDLDGAQSAKEDIIRQINSVKREGYEVKSPISITVDLEVLRQSGNPEQRQIADILAAITEVRSGISSIEKRLSNSMTSNEIKYSLEANTEIMGLLKNLKDVSDELIMQLDQSSKLFKELQVLFEGNEFNSGHIKDVRLLISKLRDLNEYSIKMASVNDNYAKKLLNQFQLSSKGMFITAYG